MSRGLSIDHLQFLEDRGLTTDTTITPDQAIPDSGYSGGLPPDYLARVKALETAMDWIRFQYQVFGSPHITKERTLARAHDFLAFLKSTELPPEDVDC